MSATERALVATTLATLALAATVQAQPLPGPPPAPHAPRIEALPQPAARGPIDLEALARGFRAEGAPRAPVPPEPQLLVFVSLAMSEPALQRLVQQAARAQAALVLRGLSEGSLTRTAFRVQRLIGNRQAAIQIDPRAFDRYAVRAVPTFVLVRPGSDPDCASARCAGGSHAAVAGDVSLDYALRQFRDRAPGFREDAARLLARLGERP